MKKALLPLLTAAASVLLLGACATAMDMASSAAKEKVFGIHKRDTLVKRVSKARDAQQETKEEFASALEEFTALTEFDGGELQDKYNKLKKQYDRAKDQSDEVKSRNDDVERVARLMFREWESEIGEITSDSLRNNSERQLASSKNRFEDLMGAMRRAEKSIDPVLETFNNHVLSLKHSLNAQAIDSLQGEVRVVEAKVDSLIREMEAAIAEADAFIQSMGN